MGGTCEERRSGPDLAAVLSDLGQRGGDQRRALARGSIGLLVSRRVIEGFGGMRERVERRPDGGVARQVERQLRLVDDAGELRAAAAAPHAPVRIADAEERRPLGARVRRRHGHEREAARGRDRLRGVDRAAAAHSDHAVDALRRLDPVGRDLLPARRRVDAELVPARAGNEKRAADSELAEEAGQLMEAPADDHGTFSRANSTNASATRLGVRPVERTSEISRVGSRPFTRAAARLPLASSGSIDEREMNVTPWPAATAAFTDSWSPSSSRTSRSRRRRPAERSSSSIICRTPAPSCIRISFSERRSSSPTVFPANRWSGGTASTTSSWKNGSKVTPL